MITDIYFALASGISLRGSVPRYATALLDGRWHDAHAAVAGVADGSARQLREGDPRILAMSDVMSLLGFDEEAEQYYARALRTCRDSDQALRMLSCRNAGWQALRRDRFRVARNCFLRIARDRDATPAQRVEACIGLTLTDHGLGQQQSAAQALDHARQFAADADDKLWGLATELLSLDLQVQTGVRTTGTLADHVFWRTAYASGAPIVARGASDPAAPSVRTAGQLHDAPPLIQRQVEYLAALATTAGGDAGALRRLGELIDESRQQGIGDVLRRMRIEALLAALAGGFATAAEHLFNAIGARQPGGKATPYVDLDLLYASAKIAAMRGEMLEALRSTRPIRMRRCIGCVPRR
ncbi:hypothetical protein ACFQVB_21785 [Paraburkholderia humisilvae]|uniref:hypothetical protein n=1 Tax=Paraburkholderia humisilvae TaxID=627669 RepID=UPI003606FA08